MARPQKEGLDYFPLDVDIDQDEKVALVEAQHGPVGFAIVIKLMMKIYKNSYFYEWGEKEQLLFSKIINVDSNLINDVINDCVKWGLFDESLFKKYKILTSKGIQRRFLDASGRRKNTEIVKEYCLIPDKTINVYKNLVIVDMNGDNVAINGINNPQSKVKESKVNKSKEKKNEDDKKSGSNNSHELSVSQASKFFTVNFGNHSPYIQEKIAQWEEDLSEEVVIASMKIALEKNVKNFNYCESILRDWDAEGLKTIEAVRFYEKEKRQKWKDAKDGRIRKDIGESFDSEYEELSL